MYLKVRVKTGQKKESVEQISGTSFAISVKEKPLENAANRRVVALMAEHLKIPVAKVRIKSGHHLPSKLLEIIE